MSPSAPSQPGSGSSGAASATATITLQIPKLAASNIGTSGSTASANGRRSPKYISPGSDKLSFILDGNAVVTDAPVAAYNNAGPNCPNDHTPPTPACNGTFPLPNNQGSVQIAFATSPSDAYFTVTALFTVTPGSHKIGVVNLSGTPAYVLSEGERTFQFNPGPNDFSSQPLALKGVVASGYIECATAAQNADTTGTCLNYANWNSGGNYYTFTAVAADFDGFPIVDQGIPFDNGTFTVAESPSDSPNGIVSIWNAGAWGTPGSDITGPSGGWIEGVGITGPFAYGHAFYATCNKVGTANLQLSLVASTPNTPAGSPDASAYPPNAIVNGLLPMGTKGATSTPRVTNVTVTCTSSGTISII